MNLGLYTFSFEGNTLNAREHQLNTYKKSRRKLQLSCS